MIRNLEDASFHKSAFRLFSSLLTFSYRGTERRKMYKVPDYLNVDYFKKAVVKAVKREDVNVKACNIEPKSAGGENFCSDIYCANLQYEILNNEHEVVVPLQKLSFIVKDMNMEIADIGSSETHMYDVVLPGLADILLERTKEHIKFNADVYLIDRVDKELYVLEDLNVAGYKLADRWLGLDFMHARLLLEKLAKFHAASMLYIEKFPEEIGKLAKAHFSEGAADPIANSIAFGGIRYASTVVQQWENFEGIANKMLENLNDFNRRVIELTTTKSDGFNVITHGDLWVNNILFNYEDGVPKDAVFVDFQNCFLGSPGFDLNFFLNTSVQLNVLKLQRYELLRHYYATLRSVLEKCEAQKIPTWQMLVDEVRRMEYLGYYSAVCELPICSMPAHLSKGFTASTFTDSALMEEKRKLMYSNERVLETLRYALDRFNELGVLD